LLFYLLLRFKDIVGLIIASLTFVDFAEKNLGRASMQDTHSFQQHITIVVM